MTSVIFVHGTGVRQLDYEISFKEIKKRLSDRQGVQVLSCLWGDTLGVKLNQYGRSVPSYDMPHAAISTDESYEVRLWAMLYLDPLYELSLFAFQAVAPDQYIPAHAAAQSVLDSRVKNFVSTANLESKLIEAGIEQEFGYARQIIIGTMEYAKAILAPPEVGSRQAAIARAFVAQSIFQCEQQNKSAPITTDVKLRDEIVQLIRQELRDPDLTVRGWPSKWLGRLGAKIIDPHLQRHRGKVTDYLSPFAGDILLYQCRGERIRTFVRERIAAAPPPVIVLAHSLGGIACFDLLATTDASLVDTLVTAGSQVPFLYEIDALHGLHNGEPFPEPFPQWLNIYDPRDILSYIGEGIFPGKVKDFSVNNRLPFPYSHSAYWKNDEVWQILFERLPL